MSANTELMQPELFGQDEHVCPGYDACPIGICGCRFLGLGTPFAMFAKLAANIAARMADDSKYDAHVAGVKKMMNA